LQWSGALVAVGALVALGLVNPPRQAQADTSPSGYDQMSGIGSTASAITVPWTQGLRNSSNQSLTNQLAGEINPNADRASGTGPTSFMDSDFSGLTVTVSQTQDIGHGGITVSWNWPGHATARAGITPQGDYLQMMECYGNATTGPLPEDCEFGQGQLPSTMPTTVGTRTGPLCSSPTLSVSNPTGSADGTGPAYGCDPYEPANPVEPTTAGTPSHHPCTAGTGGQETGPDCQPDGYSIPFVPENDPGSPLYQGELTQAFNQFNSNEVDLATTRSDGTGEQQFETLTSVQSSGLGCGQQVNGAPQGCWLVIVPRGQYEPNGFQAQVNSGGSGIGNEIYSTPLSAVNWAQRIQVHLNYAPLPTFCPLGGDADQPLMEGTQLITRAVQSWELKLNEVANCTRIYHLAETPEQQVTNDFVTPLTPGSSANGLAFTTNPVGTDRLRNGESLPTLPKIVYAPVAVMALDFGFHIDEYTPLDTTHDLGYLTTPVKLSPLLVARALTQSYRNDLPDYDVQTVPPDEGPAWSQSNPPDMSFDKTFQALNPEILSHGYNAISLAPLDTVDHSGYYQQVWQWLGADSSTAGWLNGTASPTVDGQAVTVDPAYSAQKLGTPPAIDSMPRSYPGCLDLGISSTGKPEKRCSIDMLPYVPDFDAASADVLSANPLTYGDEWDPTAVAPDGSQGYWDKQAPEAPGQTFIWAMNATPYLAAYGIIPASLCDNSGNNCMAPTVASVGAAVANAKPDSDGLLEVNPAHPGTGAYPLTDVIYAAVRTDMPAQQLSDYADFISFAANKGQTPGQAGGDLPAGYLPMTASLQAQANAAVAQLRQIAAGGSGSTTPPTASSSASSSASTPAGGPTTTGTNSGGTQPSATPNSPASTGAPNGTAGSSPASTAASCATPTVTPTATASTATPTVTRTATASPCATPTGPVIVPPTVQLAAGTTPTEPVGPIRQVLVVILIVGVAGAGGGILLRRGRLPRWPGRSRP
jgi:hypothetical protein